MWWRIACFELVWSLKRPVLYLFFVLAAAMAFFFAANTDPSVMILFNTGQAAHNAPLILTKLVAVFAAYGTFFAAVIIGPAIHKDFASRSQDFFFSSGIGSHSYLAGRFLGAFAAYLLVYVGVVLGFLAGCAGLPTGLLVPNHISAWFTAVFVFALPNLFLVGSACFVFITLTRRLTAAYVVCIVALTAYMMLTMVKIPVDQLSLAALFDPMGMRALELVTRYWSVAEINTTPIRLAGPILTNRLLWLGVAFALQLLAFKRFCFQSQLESGSESASRLPSPAARVVVATAKPKVGILADLRALGELARTEILRVLRHPAFLVLAGFTTLLSYVNFIWSLNTGEQYSSPVHPLTSWYLDKAAMFLDVMIVPVTLFFAGVIVHREREEGSAGFLHATPLPNWVFCGARLSAMMGVQTVLVAIVCFTGILVQLVQYQFTDIELGTYLLVLGGIHLSGYWLFATAAVLFQTASPNRNTGFLLTGLLVLVNFVLPKLGLADPLFRFGQTPGYLYSNLNGLGHFIDGIVWYRIYWGFFAIFLAACSLLLWRRGTVFGLVAHIRNAAVPMGRRLIPLLGLPLVGFFLTGGFIFYNTRVLNEVTSLTQERAYQAGYERSYGFLTDQPQPKITKVSVAVDLYPHRRGLRVSGDFTLVNKTNQPIDKIYVQLTQLMQIHQLSLTGLKPSLVDDHFHFYTFQPEQPLAPGEQCVLHFDLSYASKGFLAKWGKGAISGDSNLELVENGTFFTNRRYFPTIGYDQNKELEDVDLREKHGLSPKNPIRANEPAALVANCISPQADWINFEAVVSTSSDQMALAPGYLVRQWKDKGRNYFHYTMDTVMPDLYGFLSADYAVEKGHWRDVAIEVYYHPDHAYNIDRMIEGARNALAYCSEQFGPYQHRQLRIVEFPNYRTFAQSLPNTIPYSENFGFIANLDRDVRMDHMMFVTAHEIAHQWWGHQVMAANVEGAALIMESLAQYGALMVMEHHAEPQQMRNFLLNERDRYLSARARQSIAERPLKEVAYQSYLHYQKGGLAMYTLKSYIGEKALNGALHQYIADAGLKGPPYTTTHDLMGYLRQATPERYAYLIEDLFETITFSDNKVLAAHATKQGPGNWRLELQVETHKLRADGSGKEREIPVDDWLQVVVYGEDGKTLFKEMVHFQAAKKTLSIELAERPTRAGIDPNGLMFDKNLENNTVNVSENATTQISSRKP